MAKTKRIPAEVGGTSVTDLERSVATGTLHPVYLLYGEDTTLMNDVVDRIVAASLDETTKQFNLDVLDGSEVTADEVVARAVSFPMMGDRRVVIVREFDRVEKKERLAAYAANPSAHTVLMLLGTSPDFRRKEMQALKESAMAVNIPELREPAIREKISEMVRTRGYAIREDAVDELLKRVGRSFGDVKNAVEKAALFAGARKEITAKDVLEVISRTQGTDIYDLQRQIARRDARGAMESLFRLLDGGESAIGIIAMLTRYFQRIWAIEDAIRSDKGEAPSLLGIPAFTVTEYRSAAKSFSQSEVERIFGSLLTADERLKTSAGEPRLVMTILLAEILGSSAESQLA